jgi:hypothetical protein
MLRVKDFLHTIKDFLFREGIEVLEGHAQPTATAMVGVGQDNRTERTILVTVTGKVTESSKQWRTQLERRVLECSVLLLHFLDELRQQVLVVELSRLAHGAEGKQNQVCLVPHVD